MNREKEEMTTLSQVLERLKAKKYDNEFVVTEDGFSAGRGKIYKPEDLTIIKTYRFEGESDPADSVAVYLIEANDGMIGYSIDTYGAASNHEGLYDEFLKKIPVKDREDQLIYE